jgi:hypothetical protein
MMRLLFLAAVALSIFSCNKDTSREDLLVGSLWRFDVKATQDTLLLEPLSEAKYNFAQSIMSKLESVTLEFKEDKRLIVNNLIIADPESGTSFVEEPIEGAWEIDDNTLHLQLTTKGTTPYTIKEMSKDKIVIVPQGDDPFIFTRVLVPVKK